MIFFHTIASSSMNNTTDSVLSIVHMLGLNVPSQIDKASLLAQVMNHLKELRRSAAEATVSILILMDIDEVRVEQQEDGSDGDSYSIKASLCSSSLGDFW